MYNILLPVAYLPLCVHYLFATLLWPVVRYVVRYRLKVVRGNLERCFPDKSRKELRKIERQYYRHMVDLLAEGFYNIAAQLKNIIRH